MHKYLPSTFVFLDEYDKQIFKNNITNIGIIYRNYKSKKRETELNSKSAPNMFVFAKNGFFYLITILKCFLIKIKYLIK